jgi:hypothetical protein
MFIEFISGIDCIRAMVCCQNSGWGKSKHPRETVIAEVYLQNVSGSCDLMTSSEKQFSVFSFQFVFHRELKTEN